MFGIDIGGIFTGPVKAVQLVTDEKLKLAVERTAISFGYSQYITFFWSLAQEIKGRRLLGIFSAAFQNMACSSYTMLVMPGINKEIDLAVPKDMVEFLKTNDPIHWDDVKNPKGG